MFFDDIFRMHNTVSRRKKKKKKEEKKKKINTVSTHR